MLHLFSSAVNPGLSLFDCLTNWYAISVALKERVRRRIRQTESVYALIAFL